MTSKMAFFTEMNINAEQIRSIVRRARAHSEREEYTADQVSTIFEEIERAEAEAKAEAMEAVRTKLCGVLGARECAVKKPVKAVYIPTVDGEMKLARVQAFSRPLFRESGFEERKRKRNNINITGKSGEGEQDQTSLDRAFRRAKRNAFDLVLCNPDLDAFCTLTYSPEAVEDRTAYTECYEVLRGWLSNRVQRRDLKYVLVPERHKNGGIHMHMLANSGALSLARAISAKSGRKLTLHGRPIFNITDWADGFSTAELVAHGQTDREKVSKYIFKYMGKQGGERIGGRYFLHGGRLAVPLVVLGDDVQEFIDPEANARYHVDCEPVDGLNYQEWGFI